VPQFVGGQGVQLPLVRHGAPGTLTLADGSVYQGFSFGASVAIAGEVVFNTGARAWGASQRAHVPYSPFCPP
jgi:hypothetical protein